MSLNGLNSNNINFENVCRVCLGNYELQSIKENSLVIEILRILIGVDYETDNLPKKICLMCFGTFHEIYNFTLKCRETHLFLLENMNRAPVDSIDDIEVQIEQENQRLIAELNQITGRTCDSNVNRYIGWTNPGESLNKPESIKSDEEFILESEKSDTSSESETDDDLRQARKRGPYKKNNEKEKKTINKCEICNSYFPKLLAFELHKKKHENPIVCEICQKPFLDQRKCDAHKLTHNGERPFKCDQCAKTFHTRQKLKRHLAVHDRKEAAFKCDVCAMDLLSKLALKEHKKTHKPFKCGQCEKWFKTERGLETHKCKTDIENNPTDCNISENLFFI